MNNSRQQYFPNPSISIFFPAYNEEENLEESIRLMKDSVSSITSTYELIIVNDGSSDRTGLIGDELALRHPDHVKVVHHEGNKGYGAALISGMKAAKYDWIFFTDTDLQFDVHELSLLVKHIGNYSLIIGYRANRQDPFIRLVNAKVWNWLNRAVFGLKVKDIDCAFKLFRRELVHDLPLQSRGAMLSAEILIRIMRKGVPVKEVPVTHLPRTRGVATGAKPSVIIRALREMVALSGGDLGNKSLLEFIKFAIIGVVNTSIDIGLYFVLTRYALLQDLVFVKGITYFAGTVFSFAANRYFTFSKYSAVRLLEVGRFYVTALAALLVNIGTMYMLIKVVGLSEAPSVLISTLVTIGFNFTFMKFWVFLEDDKEELLTHDEPKLKRDNTYRDELF